MRCAEAPVKNSLSHVLMEHRSIAINRRRKVAAAMRISIRSIPEGVRGSGNLPPTFVYNDSAGSLSVAQPFLIFNI